MFKRILAFIGISLLSYGAMVWGKLSEHPAILYIGIAIACALGLGILVWLTKKLIKFIGWAMASTIYLVAGIITVCLLSWHDVLNNFAGVMVALVFGVLLSVSVIRKLASWAQKSVIGSEIFAFVSGYQIRNIIKQDKLLDKDTVIELNNEMKNLIAVLKEMKYNKNEAKEAAIYVVQQYPQEPIESKITKALQYLNPNINGRNN